VTERFRPAWREGSGPIPRYVVQPTERLLRIEAASGLALVLAAGLAVLWANVDAASYRDVWETRILLDFSVVTLDKAVGAWVNDALMVLFFFLVGMEIKRELTHGELADRRQAVLPVVGALGGMIAPALIFTAVTAGGDGGRGWGIPVATDIAFALGVLALLGGRIPSGLKVFLLALAVVDDIGGIFIIAVFYTDEIAPGWLATAGGLVVLLTVMNRVGVRAVPAYVIVGAAFWFATFQSGVHATIAGVILGLLTPVGSLYDPERVPDAMRARLAAFEAAAVEADPHARDLATAEAMRELEEYAREALSPLERI